MSSSGDNPFEKLSAEDALAQLKTNQDKGLSAQDVEARIKDVGYNEIQEKKKSIFLQIFGYFWGPIPWMIEIAAILSGVLEHWPDFIMITALLLINAILGFWHEHQAANAIDALKDGLALKARALRDGKWEEVEARTLVPGDIISLKIGNIIPADVKLLKGEYLSVDQAALTGESLPVDKEVGGTAFSGTIVKKGEMEAVVTLTGMNTYFGKTAQLVQTAKTDSHFQKALTNIGRFLIIATLVVVAVIFVVSLFRASEVHQIHEQIGKILVFVLVLVVAGIPVALPSVMSVTLAIGAHKIAQLKAILTKLIAIEELAGMNVLCSDKTGTLTQNLLTVGEVVAYEGSSEEDLVLCAALCSKKGEGDAIDDAIFTQLKSEDTLAEYTLEKFLPFDPVSKRTEASLKKKDGSQLFTCKGAPQIILDLAKPPAEFTDKVNKDVEEFAKKGFRTLGVARRNSEGNAWEFLGLIPLFDPPRESAKETIQYLKEVGVKVKMITGDNKAIATQIAQTLDLGTNIVTLGDMEGEGVSEEKKSELLDEADGFAEVFPEHKYAIVQNIQAKKDIVGMTGDGVNDAPALKQADIGIAVSNATDAARAAADLVLTDPGLTVISNATQEARKIFGRLRSYAIYRISETCRLLLFLSLAMLVFNVHPLSAIMIILIALLNDIPIMMIAYDHMRVDPKPVIWQMKEVYSVAVGLAIVGVVSTFGLYWMGERFWDLGSDKCSTLAFMGILCGGNLTIYLTRNVAWAFTKPYPEWKFFCATIFSQLVGTFAAAYGLGTPDFVGIGWKYVGYAWIYIAVWFGICMLSKWAIYHLFRLHRPDYDDSLDQMQKPISKS